MVNDMPALQAAMFSKVTATQHAVDVARVLERPVPVQPEAGAFDFGAGQGMGRSGHAVGRAGCADELGGGYRNRV